jgi:O-antigen/teichoic acid export membrane protein
VTEPEEGDRKQDLAVTGRALGTSFAVSGAIQLLNVVTGILLARTLGPTDRGALAAALLWPMLLGAIGLLGVMEAATYHAARRSAPVAALVGSGLALVLAQSIIFTAAAALLLPIVLNNQSSEALEASRIFLLYIPLNMTILFLAGFLNGRRRYGHFQILRILVIVATTALLAALAIREELTVTHAVIAYLLASALTLALTVVFVQRETGTLRFDRRVARGLFRYGIRSHASTISSQFNERLDQVVISIFLTSRSLGIYVVAVTLTSATYLVGMSVAWVVLPQVAPLDPGPTRTTIARRFVQLTLIGSFLISLPIALLAEPLIRLTFGDAFLPATGPTRLLLLAVILLSVNRVLEAILRAVGRPLDAGVAELIALGTTLGGLAVLVPFFDLMGAAGASLVAYGVASAWMSQRVSRALDIPVREMLAVRRSDLRWMRERVASAAR